MPNGMTTTHYAPRGDGIGRPKRDRRKQAAKRRTARAARR